MRATGEAKRKSDDLEAEVRDLCSRGRHRDAAALALQAYGPELFAFLVAILRDREDAEEAFAQTGLDLYSGIARFRFHCTFRTWVYVIARNACRREMKRRLRRRERPLEEIDVEDRSELHARARTTTRPYLRTDVKHRVALLRAQLTPAEQTLLVLRIDRGFSWIDIARIMRDPCSQPDEAALKRTAASCRKRFERLTARLRTFAEREGLLKEAGR